MKVSDGLFKLRDELPSPVTQHFYNFMAFSPFIRSLLIDELGGIGLTTLQRFSSSGAGMNRLDHTTNIQLPRSWGRSYPRMHRFFSRPVVPI